MDGIVPIFALLLTVTFTVNGVALVCATYFAFRGPRSQSRISYSHWTALVSLVVSLPTFGLCLVLMNTVVGWMPAAVSLSTVGWSAIVLKRAIAQRR
jgi:hypothetical protein